MMFLVLALDQIRQRNSPADMKTHTYKMKQYKNKQDL